MDRYFAKRTAGDLAETQKIIADVGHSRLVAQAYSNCLNKHRKNGATTQKFFSSLKVLLNELGKLGYTRLDWKVPGGRVLPIDSVNPRQFLGSFASIQQAIGKWLYNHTLEDPELLATIHANDLVFKANDVQAVMNLLFELLIVDHDNWLHDLATKVLTCLRT